MSCLVFLVLMVLRFAHEDAGTGDSASARVAIERGRFATTQSQLDSAPATESVGAEPVSAEPSVGSKPTLESPVSTPVVAIPKSLIFQKTRIVSTGAATKNTSSISIRDIQPSFVKSPVYILEKGPAKTFTPRRWLRVVVTFDSFDTHVRELRFRYTISMGNETFVGELIHSDIIGAGEHQAAAFIIPPAIEAVIQRGDFDANKSVAIEVVVLAGETELARASFGERPGLPGREKSGFLRSVEDTPFAPLEIDVYELTEARSR